MVIDFTKYDLTEYQNFTFSDFIDLKEYSKVDKFEDLFNNFKPLIISEDLETGTLLIRKKIKFGENDSYIYRLVKFDGSATEPRLLFSSQYQCLIWNKYVIDMINGKLNKQSAINLFKFLSGLLTYSEFIKIRDEIGDDSDYIF